MCLLKKEEEKKFFFFTNERRVLRTMMFVLVNMLMFGSVSRFTDRDGHRLSVTCDRRTTFGARV